MLKQVQKRKGGRQSAAPVSGVAAAGFAAAAISGGLGLVWVWSLVGERALTADPFAILAGLLLAGVIVVAEAYAVLMLNEWEKRRGEAGGALKAKIAFVIYAAAELLNASVGALGVMTVNDKMIESARAPLEASLAQARALAAAADDAVAHFDAETDRIAQRYDDELKGTRENAAMAVTARRGTAADATAASSAREIERNKDGGVVAKQTAARTAVSAAELALDGAPKAMSLLQEIAAAFVLLLFKGPGVWAATAKSAGEAPKPQPVDQPRGRLGGLLPPKRRFPWSKIPARSMREIIDFVTREDVHALCAEDRAALHKQAKQVAGWCQHAPAF